MLRNCVCLALAQEDGDVNVMRGRFQEMYEHSVPLVKEWPDSLHEFRDELNQWERDFLVPEWCEGWWCGGTSSLCGGIMSTKTAFSMSSQHLGKFSCMRIWQWRWLNADRTDLMEVTGKALGQRLEGWRKNKEWVFNCWPKFLDLTTSSASIYLLSFWNWTSFPFQFVSLFCSKYQISKLLLASKKSVRCNAILVFHESQNAMPRRYPNTRFKWYSYWQRFSRKIQWVVRCSISITCRCQHITQIKTP